MTTEESETTADSTKAAQHPRASTTKKTLLWFLAFLLAAAAMIYQRATGPTYPVKGSFVSAGKTYNYKLIRTHETTASALVTVPWPGDAVVGELHWKRFNTSDDFTAEPLTKQTVDGEDQPQFAAPLPKQPAAGKLEYYVVLTTADGELRLPEKEADNPVLRYKDPVPDSVLIPHVTMMIFSILFGMRAGLSALFEPGGMRLWSWLALAGMTVGGMMLGPIVQKYAFGEYWTGFPWGGDWTDNKMLFMWLAWLLGCSVIGFSVRKKEIVGRLTVLAAAVVMTAVYLIPHSMGGSELDYEQIEQGVDPQDAIKTG